MAFERKDHGQPTRVKERLNTFRKMCASHPEFGNVVTGLAPPFSPFFDWFGLKFSNAVLNQEVMATFLQVPVQARLDAEDQLTDGDIDRQLYGTLSNGVGTFTYGNGDSYVGPMVQHGKGVRTTSEGTQYEEVWEAGKRVSRKEKKTAEFDDGVYEGGLKHGLPYGKGL